MPTHPLHTHLTWYRSAPPCWGFFVFHALAALPAEHLVVLVLDLLEGWLVSLLVDGDHDEVRKEDRVDVRLGQQARTGEYLTWTCCRRDSASYIAGSFMAALQFDLKMQPP